MADKIKLDLVTPDRRLISAEVDELVAEGFLGQFGVLPGHANYVTLLEPGEISYRQGSEKVLMAVSGGFAEVSLDEGVRIMAETAELAQDIDLERAKSAKERAEKRISEFDPGNQEVDIARAQASLKRALVRINVGEKGI